jgi:hypothetical protein
MAVEDLLAQNQRFFDSVDRIVQRINLTQCHEGTPVKTIKHDASIYGPLTVSEMGELSLLCSLASTLQVSNDSTPCGFASVELDQLSALTELLDRHVNLAAGINLIQQAHDIVIAEGSSASALDKVRFVIARIVPTVRSKTHLDALFHFI